MNQKLVLLLLLLLVLHSQVSEGKPPFNAIASRNIKKVIGRIIRPSRIAYKICKRIHRHPWHNHTCLPPSHYTPAPAPAPAPGRPLPAPRPTYSPVPSPAPHSSSVPGPSPFSGPVPGPVSPYSPVPSPGPSSGSPGPISPYAPVPSTPGPSSGSPGLISPYAPVPSTPGPSSGSPGPSPDSGTTPDDVILGPYVATFSVGSSQQNVSLVIDISLSFTFMMCQQCESDECSTDEPVFVPLESKTLRTVPCPGKNTGVCLYSYASPDVTSASYLSEDTFYFGDGSSYPIDFGCGNNNTGDYGNSIGYFGLGASGDLSFLNQANISIFSYCFNSDPSGYSPFFFDPDIECNTASRNSTKLINNPNDPTSYAINLIGVSVGDAYIPVPFTGNPDGTGGISLSSTYIITFMEDSVYDSIKAEFKKQTKLTPVNGSEYYLDLCYTTYSEEMPNLPQLTLHFDGADMNLNLENYFPYLAERVLCLAMLPSGDGGISVLGTLMQQDMQMIYDVGRNVLEYDHADCNRL